MSRAAAWLSRPGPYADGIAHMQAHRATYTPEVVANMSRNRHGYPWPPVIVWRVAERSIYITRMGYPDMEMHMSEKGRREHPHRKIFGPVIVDTDAPFVSETAGWLVRGVEPVEIERLVKKFAARPPPEVPQKAPAHKAYLFIFAVFLFVGVLVVYFLRGPPASA